MKRLTTLIAIALAACCCAAEEDDSRTLSVSGTGTIQVTATIADVTLGVEAIAPKAHDAQRLLADRQRAVLEAIRNDSAAEAVESKHISLYPRYAEGDYTQIIGYTATSDITFTTTVEEAGRLIAVGIEAGANKNRGVSVRASEEKLAEARVSALKQAADLAMGEGKTVLEALGLTFQGIHRVEVGSGNRYVPLYQPYKMEAARVADAPVEVTEQEIDVQASIALVLKFLQ